MNDERASDHGLESQPGETPMDWLIGIAPEKWGMTEDGYDLILQSGDRRAVVDPLAEQTAWEERIETGEDAFGERWVQREVIEGRWYVQTTAGLLLWGVSDTSEEEPIRATNEAESRCEGSAHESKVR